MFGELPVCKCRLSVAFPLAMHFRMSSGSVSVMTAGNKFALTAVTIFLLSPE
jgi:hypothetical protein